jgi:ADP-ribosyl-[dinitrogen reductase] hydrolase
MIESQLKCELSPLAFGAIGDAYGFCFEFAEAGFVGQNNDLAFHQHPKFSVSPGVYSDDTQMHMALAEVIASGREWTPREIAQAFVDVFKRDPRQGYANGFHAFLTTVRDGDQFLAQIRPDSERNGAAMRAPVIGLYSSTSEVMSRSEIQAKLTHDTKGGVDSAIASSLLCHFFAYELGAKEEAPAFLRRHVPGHDWERPWTGKVEVHGISTVRAALSAIVETDSLAELLKKCVSYTGDVDSVATIALASASGSPAFTRDLPGNLWQGLENSEFGIQYLIDLDRRVRDITNASMGVRPASGNGD